MAKLHEDDDAQCFVADDEGQARASWTRIVARRRAALEVIADRRQYDPARFVRHFEEAGWGLRGDYREPHARGDGLDAWLLSSVLDVAIRWEEQHRIRDQFLEGRGDLPKALRDSIVRIVRRRRPRLEPDEIISSIWEAMRAWEARHPYDPSRGDFDNLLRTFVINRLRARGGGARPATGASPTDPPGEDHPATRPVVLPASGGEEGRPVEAIDPGMSPEEQTAYAELRREVHPEWEGFLTPQGPKIIPIRRGDDRVWVEHFRLVEQLHKVLSRLAERCPTAARLLREFLEDGHGFYAARARSFNEVGQGEGRAQEKRAEREGLRGAFRMFFARTQLPDEEEVGKGWEFVTEDQIRNLIGRIIGWIREEFEL